MEKKEKAPVLRFKDTNGKDYPAWEQRELKDVAEIVGGGTPSTSVPAYWNGSIDWYSPTEIGQENFAKGSKRKISNEGLNNSSAKLLPAHKTILFTSRATIGEAAILEREGATNQGFQSIVTKEGVDVYFLYSYKHHLKKQALIKASGSTFLEISKNEVEGLHVPVPSGEEQAKIGSFFKLVDKAITLHQRKLEALKKLKRTLLQKMFPKKDQLNPELRFPGFTNDWEQRKLKDFTLSYSGGTPTVSNKNYYNGTIPFIRSGEISGERTELFITEEGLNKSSAKSVHKGQILYALYGATSGEVSLSKIDGAINQAILAISTKEGYSNAFLSFWLRKEKDRITATFLQGGQGNLSGEIVKNLIVPIPSQLEQTKIGDFFNQLDGIITLHQRKLETYKKLKKGLLQKMFI